MTAWDIQYHDSVHMFSFDVKEISCSTHGSNGSWSFYLLPGVIPPSFRMFAKGYRRINFKSFFIVVYGIVPVPNSRIVGTNICIIIAEMGGVLLVFSNSMAFSCFSFEVAETHQVQYVSSFFIFHHLFQGFQELHDIFPALWGIAPCMNKCSPRPGCLAQVPLPFWKKQRVFIFFKSVKNTCLHKFKIITIRQLFYPSV